MIPESEQAGGGGLNHTSDLLDPRRAEASGPCLDHHVQI